MDNETCYAMIDRFLQNNLYSDDYEEYLEALDQLCQPYPRTWVGLTDEEIDKAWRSVDYTVPWEQHRIDIAKAIEAKLKQKNGFAEENT
jgi:hypothetical protein